LLAGRPKWPKYHKNLEFPGTSILLVFRAGTYFHALNQCFFGSNGNSGALNGHFLIDSLRHFCPLPSSPQLAMSLG
jgi:hypothetical protein